MIDPDPYIDQCIHDLVLCDYNTVTNCHCGVVEAYIASCLRNGIIVLNWRANSACDIICPAGMAWEETTTLGTRKCGFQHAISSLESTNNYVGACKCTDGKYENQYGQCVHKDECPCTFSDHLYSNGEKVQMTQCKTCECVLGTWECSDEECPRMAYITNLAHVKTFDGVVYDMKGNCEFTFIQDTRPGATFYVSVEIDSCSADDASFCLRSFHFVWQMNTVTYQLVGSLNDLQLNHETIQYYS